MSLMKEGPLLGSFKRTRMSERSDRYCTFLVVTVPHFSYVGSSMKRTHMLIILVFGHRYDDYLMDLSEVYCIYLCLMYYTYTSYLSLVRYPRMKIQYK